MLRKFGTINTHKCFCKYSRIAHIINTRPNIVKNNTSNHKDNSINHDIQPENVQSNVFLLLLILLIIGNKNRRKRIHDDDDGDDEDNGWRYHRKDEIE